MRTLLLLLVFVCANVAMARQPDVLMIAIDDLNYVWDGMNGNRAKTPNLDRLKNRGVNFANAHCQAPICNPSRASLMTGRYPSTTGIYYLAPLIRNCDTTRDLVTIPQHFAVNGYETIGIGKLFHTKDQLEFQSYLGSFGGMGPRPKKPLIAGHTHPLWDWGEYPDSDEEMPDYKIASKACEVIADPSDKPRFLAVGFYRPHVPMYAPKKWFDLYEEADYQPHNHDPKDLDDVPQYGQDLSWSRVAPRHSWMVENNQVERGIHSYLACVSFVDSQVGRLLDALDKSPNAENTIVVLWSDHGFHTGSKQRWGKRSLWHESTHVPLIFAGKGMKQSYVGAPVGLIDIYPTLVELCGLSEREGLEGRSLTPFFANPNADWPHAALCTFGQNNHAVIRNELAAKWRYIRYADGSEELYNDGGQQNLLYWKRGYEPVAERLAGFHPKVNVPMASGSKAADARPGSAAEIEPDRRPRPKK